MTKVLIIGDGGAYGRVSKVLGALGLTSSGKRTIGAGEQYNQFFDLNKVKGDEITLMPDGDVYDTIKEMDKIAAASVDQTKLITAKLKASSLDQTLRNLWNFLYHNVQYKKDHPLREQLRTPIRTWKDRKAGVDCDCYAVFISSVLKNLKVPHQFRIAAYSEDFQHVYVVVPKDGKTLGARSTYYVVDPVVDKYDYEEPFSKKFDSNMKITTLNGIAGLNGEACATQIPVIKRLRHYISTQEVEQAGLVPTIKFLNENKIPFQEVVNGENNSGSLVVHTPNGIRNVPTIITKDQAAQLLNDYTTPIPIDQPKTVPAPSPGSTPVATSKPPVDDTSKKYPWWVWLAIAGGALYVLGNSDEAPSRSTSNDSLEGVTRKKKKRKLKTLYV